MANFKQIGNGRQSQFLGREKPILDQILLFEPVFGL